MFQNSIFGSCFPDAAAPKLIDHIVHNILTATYNSGLYHESKVLHILSKITPLDGFQIHAWFNCKRHSSEPPERKDFMTIEHRKGLGTWSDEKRTILEKCFGEDVCTPENFAFIGLLTGLSKNQISNWTRQKRYLLRKKGLLPPVNKSTKPTRRRKKKGVSLERKITIQDRNVLLESKDAQLGEEVDSFSFDSPKLHIPESIQLPPEDAFFHVLELNRPNMDEISKRIFQNAQQGGLFDDDEYFELVSLLAAVNPSLTQFSL